MTAKLFKASAVTTEVEFGTEQQCAGRLIVKNRVFTDVVRSSDSLIAGTNFPDMNLDIDLETMSGKVHGTFVWQTETVDGQWEGEIVGELSDGLVKAYGLGKGTGTLDGALLRVDFQQVNELGDPPEIDEPLALYEMSGIIVMP